MTELEIQKRLHKQNIWIDCTQCQGTGYVYKCECSECKGTGKVRKPQPHRNFKKVLL